jgi:negative regulator of sigma E activity
MTTVDDMADDFELAPPDKLALHHRQQLSAMLDGELSPDRAKFMLRRLQHDDELAACWERWQVCGDMLRGCGHALLPADFAQRVARAIAEDGAGSAATAGAAMRKSRIARWGGSAALAASVALVAIFVARQLPGDVAPPSSDAPTGLAAETIEVPVAPVAADPLPPSSANLTTAAMAGAVAAIEVPRRAAERRSRGQSQRAATRARQRAVEAPVLVANRQGSTTPTPDGAVQGQPAAGSALASRADPFAAQVDTQERPWPRSLLPGLTAVGGGFLVSANQGPRPPMVDAAFAGFEPRLQPSDSVEAAVPADAVVVDAQDEVMSTDTP